MRKRAFVLGLALVTVAAVAVLRLRPEPARADAYIYSAQKREIKVCNLLLESFRPKGDDPAFAGYKGLENADPHLFYILDSRSDLKPRNWELVNPLAPRVVTQQIRDRWLFLDPAHPYQIGQPVTKNMACYWEVYLDTNNLSSTLDELLQFDLVFLTSHIGMEGPGPTPQNVRFTPADREALRKLADMGGTLWLEDCWLMRIEPQAGMGFFLDINFEGQSLAGYNGRPRFGALVADPHHPILNSPFRLTEEEINRLGDKNVDDYRITGAAGLDSPPDPRLFPIVNNAGDFGLGPGAHPYVAGAHYGNGRILITSGDTGCAVNDAYTDPPGFKQVTLNPPERPDFNGGAYCGALPPKKAVDVEDVKFVYNVLNWAQGDSNYRRGPRRSGYTREEVSAPLDVSWRVPLAGDIRISTGPVVSRNIAYFGTDDGWIYAVDARPYDDRDGDGNPNDGLPQGIGTTYDLTPASPYDIIWAFNLNARASAMFVSTTRAPSGAPVEALYFTTSAGEVGALNAMPVDPISGQLLGTTSVLWRQADIGTGLSAPVVTRGIVYVLSRVPAAGQYRLSMFRADNGQSPFPWWQGSPYPYTDLGPIDPGDNDANILPPVTVTLIRDERNGGNAEVAYATLPNGDLAAVATSVTGETAKYLRAVDTDNDGTPDQTRYQLRHSWVQDRNNDGTPDPLVVLQYNGAQFIRTWPAIPVPGPGGTVVPDQFAIGTAASPVVIPQGHRIVVESYQVEFRALGGGRAQRTLFVRAPGYNDPTNPDPPRARILSGAAVAADDTVYFASGNGIVHAVQERGGGGTSANDDNQVLWRYNLNDYAPDLIVPVRDFARPDRYVPDSPRWVPARFGDSNADNQAEWTPLPPAVSDNTLYTAMNRYVLLPNQNAPDRLLEGRLFAFERRATFWLDLDDPMTGVGYDQFYPIVPIPAIDPATITGNATVWQYCPEGVPGTAAALQAAQINFEDPDGPGVGLEPGDPGWYSARLSSGFFSYDRASNRVFLRNFGAVFTASLPAINVNTGLPDPNSSRLPLWVDPDGPSPQSGPRPNEQFARPFKLAVRSWPLDPPTTPAPRMPINTDNLVWQFPDPLAAGVDPSNPPQGWLGGCRGGISSPPSVSGGVLYLGTADGRLLALDADPRDGSDGTRADQGGTPVFTLDDDGWQDATNGFVAAGRLFPEWTPVPPPIWPPPGASTPAERVWPLTAPPDVLWSWGWNAQTGVGQPSAVPKDPAGTAGLETPGGACITSGLVSAALREVEMTSQKVRGVLYGFVEPVYAVADANRLLQVNRDGRALWTLNETILRTAKNFSTLPANDVPYGASPGDIITTHVPLNQPQSATRVSADMVLVADTGNNRAIALDQSGTVLWQATEVYDPYEVLPDGEYQIGVGYNNEQGVRVSYLSSPTDVVQWVSPDVRANGQLDFNIRVRHTLIADAGNHRVLEIVDKYRQGVPGYLSRTNPTSANPTPSGEPCWYHVVVWASQTNVSHRDPYGPNSLGRWRAGAPYQYTSVQPIEYTRDSNNTGYPLYVKRALVTISNYALYRVGNTRQQRVGGASLAILEGFAKTKQPLPTTGSVYQSYILDDPSPAAEPGYVSRIGVIGNTDPNRLDATSRAMLRPVSIRRFRFKWGGQQEWHDLYVDATGIYQWRVPDPARLPDLVLTPRAQCVNADADGAQYRMYSQFWRESYQQMMKTWEEAEENAYGKPGGIVPDPNNANADFQTSSFIFEPGSVTLMPGGGWVVTNRRFDRALSSVLQQVDVLAGAPPSRRDRNIQVFQLRSNPSSEMGTPGDYDPSALPPPWGNGNFGYAQRRYDDGSITFLFGPQIRDLKSGQDLGVDLSGPMFAVRTE